MTENGNKKYPVSEYFVSPQGEGVYQGCTMFFLRLAGCTVGKPYPKEMYKLPEGVCGKCGGTADQHDSPTYKKIICSDYTTYKAGATLPIYTEQCTLYDSRKFPCDTDYRVKERLTVDEIKILIPDNVRRVCITGGEPCMHDLSSLLTGLYSIGKQLHIETSGTILFDSQPIWVTVSPKKGCLGSMLNRADELKLLVDDGFDPETFAEIANAKPVYLHPVNYENTINTDNLQMCMDIQKTYPQYRVGCQLHKAISMLTNNHVR